MTPYFRQFHGPTDWGYVQTHVPGLLRVDDTTGIVGIDLDVNETCAIVILDTWTRTSVQAHWIVTRPLILRHGFLEEGFDYVFNHADREIMIGLVPSDNKPALRMVKHLGFTEIARVKDGYDFGVDTVINELRKGDCTRLPQIAEAAD